MTPDPSHSRSDSAATPGEMGGLLRAFGWAHMPPALQPALSILLSSQHPLIIFWGPEHRCLYNDAFAKSVGLEKRGRLLCELGRDLWPESWPAFGPHIEQVMSGGGSTWHENQVIPHVRGGALEEAYWTYSCSPIPDVASPTGVGGVLVIGTETTHHVLTERRKNFLIDLDDAMRQVNDAALIVDVAITALGRHLRANRVGFGRVLPDEQSIDLKTNYTDGAAPVIGTYRLDAFGAHNISRQRRGETVVWNDVAADALADPATWNKIETRAFVSVPLVRDGRLRATLFVNQRHPRGWKAHEVALIERVATRIRDALERAEAETQLLLTTQRFELALQGSFVTLAHQDRDLRYTWLYNRALQLPVFDAIGKTDEQLFLPEEAAALIALKRDVMHSRRKRREAVSITAQGVRRHFDLLVEPLLNSQGGVDGVRCAAFDITDLKETELALRASQERSSAAEFAVIEREERLATLANAMPQLVWIGRSDGTLEYVNQRLLDYTGVEEAKVKNRETWAHIIHPQDQEQSMVAWNEAMLEGKPYAIEHRLRGHDGSYRWFLVRAQPEHDAAGRVVRWYGTSTDIDEAKQLQDDLVAAEAALRDADRRKDLFLATLSHELRNPLAPIRNAAQILGSPAVGPQHLQWAQAVIQRQVKHIAWLLDDLLDVARITQGKLELKMAAVALTHVVDAAVETARPQIDDKKHQLTVNLPSIAPVLQADLLRLSQVVSNLLTNAAKYTDPGGHIELSARVEGGSLRLTVKDDGIGIAPESIERIFEMFSQVDSGSARSDGGLGIGLALVKGLVELHGGTIEARSAGLGLGSEFTIRLALDAAGRNTMRPEQSEVAARAAPGRRVLIADDNKDAADSLALLVEMGGHEVRVAHGGRAALALAQAFRPDVVLLDLGMPDMSGYEVAGALRGESWGRAIQLVALTGWGQEGDRERTTAAGFDRHLTKPIDADVLNAVLIG